MKQFEKIRIQKPKQAAFDLSHERKFTMEFGKLTPILCEPVLPSDIWRVNYEALMRLQPMLAPVMHRIEAYVHYFFVPNRIIWDDFEQFITGGVEGDSLITIPKLVSKGSEMPVYVVQGELADYLGMATGSYQGGFNQLPFRAYQTIYNEYYRDQNMEEPIFVPKSSQDLNYDSNELAQIRTRNFEKDYFTSALPTPQRGAAVTIPIGDKAVIKGDVKPYVVVDSGPDPQNYLGFNNQGKLQQMDIADQTMRDVYADLSESTSTQITELRRAYALQRFKEKLMRGGARYTEYLLSIFAQHSSDARLQRPEYLGGGKLPIRIAEVLQMSATQSDSPQGNMAGHAVLSGQFTGFSKKFEEHGYIMGILSVLPKTEYVNGTRRHFFHESRFDIPIPDFAHIGEQPVWKGELYPMQTADENRETFGYQRRYAEFTTIPSTVHGDLKDSLDYWHLGRKFSSAPPLNNEFVRFDPSVLRCFPVLESELPLSTIIVNSYSSIQAIRPIPKWGNPI